MSITEPFVDCALNPQADLEGCMDGQLEETSAFQQMVRAGRLPNYNRRTAWQSKWNHTSVTRTTCESSLASTTKKSTGTSTCSCAVTAASHSYLGMTPSS